jgi:glycosyltransferase involved in cell wall biosynthesis
MAAVSSSTGQNRNAAQDRDTVLVLASTFPTSPTDPVPAFVLDQVNAMAVQHPELDFAVLAPHDRRSETTSVSRHKHYTEYRFHYFWPRGAERLAGRGIMPALRESPILYLVVPFLFLGEYFATMALVRKLRPALIYAHWFTPQALVASWVGRATKTPFVFTTHASDVDVWRRIPRVGPALVRGASRRAKAITAVSSRSRDKLTTFFEGESSLAVPLAIIPMGVPIPDVTVTATERAALKKAAGLTGKTVYLFIGRLVEKKGVAYLLEALASPAASGLKDWALVIAGDGPLLESTRAEVARHGLSDRVVFTGYVSGADKDRWFRTADAMVVPSIIADDGDAEGLPVALLEGLAYGLPTIATRESGADDIVTDGVNGLLCAQKDAPGLLRQLLRLYELRSPDRAKLSDEAWKLAQSFSWPFIARKHYDFLFAPLLGEETQTN